MTNSLFIGRYQPFHQGHIKLIRKVLNEGKSVVVAIREMELSEDNPYSVGSRKLVIETEFKKEVKNGKLKTIVIPNITEVCYGRKVGWAIRRVRLDKQTEEISGTKLRNNQKRVIWLTGNCGSGKTSIAYLLKERLNGVILDGDEMRQSISLGAGFSKKDREEHNLRVARLANILQKQGLNVIVSVIAPFQSIRDKLQKICNPYWIYLKSPELGKDRPYEEPKNPDITIDSTKESLLQSLDKIIKEVGGLK